MQLIGARLEREVHDRTAGLPVLCIEVGGLHIDLLNGVNRGLCFVEDPGGWVGAGSTINANFLREALQAVLAGHGPGLVTADRSARNETQEAHRIPHRAAEIYRKLAEFLGRHRGRYLCRLGLQHAGIGVDFHRFRNLANLQHHVLRDRLAHAHSNAILPVCPEPGLLDRQAIHGRRQLVENVLPGFARDSFAEGICGGIGDYYSRTCDDSTGRIGNEAGDGTTIALREQHRVEAQHEYNCPEPEKWSPRFRAFHFNSPVVSMWTR